MRFFLEKYSGPKSRFTCPKCGRKGEFVRYVDENGRYFGDDIGRCNREIKCGYHKKPNGVVSMSMAAAIENYDMSIMSINLFQKFKTTKDNPIYPLMNRFGIDENYMREWGITDDLTFSDGVVYWEFVNSCTIQGAVRIRYDKRTCKRRHDKPSTYINKHYGYGVYHRRYPFGYHKLRYDRPAIMVESQKTAVVMSRLFPQYDWLATCGSGVDQIAPRLFDLPVVCLCPDKGKEMQWAEKAKKYNWKVLFLPNSVKKDNYDLLDYIIDYGRMDIEI